MAGSAPQGEGTDDEAFREGRIAQRFEVNGI
jgi:hypothetical protein